ncbi:hypothetical protein INR49_027010 [Caranx melampygus]|nr:hypothetical protein INR49_027010 [Caranx melampygus]
MEQQKKQDSDSGVGSDNGDKRLSVSVGHPSDEDSLSLNVPMSHITEEEGISKDDSSEHISALTAADFDEPLRIEEDSHWQTEQTGQDSDDSATTPKRDDRSPAGGSPSFSSPPFGLKPRSAPPSLPCSPPSSCLDPSLLSQASPLRRDTPRSHDDGGEHSRVFLRSHKSLESSIESRLKVVLPEDLGSSLMDGVVLCHLANHIRPRSVGSIHVPSPAVPKLSMAKCRRNVENFLDACRKIGVPESSLCSPYDIIQCRLQPLRATLRALVALDTASLDRKREEPVSTPNPASPGVSETPSLVSVTTQTPPPAWQIWDIVGSSLVHILCLVLLFVAYSWSELT